MDKKKPKFKAIQHKINLPIKTVLKVSQDISKDLSGYLDTIIKDLVIQEDCIDLYEKDNFDIPESFYTIFGFVGELLLIRYEMLETKNFGFIGWIRNSDIFYTESDHLINMVYDYGLNKYINDLALWKEKLLDIELDLIINSPTKLELIELIGIFSSNTKTVFITNSFYQKYSLETIIKNFCSVITNNELIINPTNIIIIAMLFNEFNNEVRKDFLYKLVDSVLILNNLNKLINQITTNSEYVWKNFLSGNKIYFQKNISVEKKLINKNILLDFGFNYKYDKNIFKKGLKFGINGICDIYNESTQTLIEIKTCIKTSFSNEWVLQIIVYNLLLKLTGQSEQITNNYIINLYDGSIYKINFNPDIQILSNILKFYDFNDFLINFLLT